MHVSHVSDTCRSERANTACEAAAARRGAARRARAVEWLARWPARRRRRTRSSGFEDVDAAIAPRSAAPTIVSDEVPQLASSWVL
jgi:hypothetical protein